MQSNQSHNNVDKILAAFYSNSVSTPAVEPDSSFPVDATQLNPQLMEAINRIAEPRFRAVATQLGDKLLHIDAIPASPGELVPIPTTLPTSLQTALHHLGIRAFYSHQALALEVLRSGRDITVSTATSSGKTLCFTPAILESCLLDPNTSAMMLFPLKALAQDQMGKLKRLVEVLPPPAGIKVGLITGDTPVSERQRLFIPNPPRILGLNPDILHFKLYATCKSDESPWREYLRQLRWVVVDEAHTYVGAFGAHFANLMRRLKVAVDSAGGNAEQIQFIFSTATVGNPVEMALRFSGREATPQRLELIDQSGAGNAERTLLCLQPSRSGNLDTAYLATSLMQKGLSTLIFTPTKVAAIKVDVNQLKEQVRTPNQETIPQEYVSLWESHPTALALHSMAHQIILATPLVVLSSNLDIDFIIAKEQNHTAGYFFETNNGGNGTTDAIFNKFHQFAAAAKSLAQNCACKGGCPRCLTIFRCPQQNRDLCKEVGLFLLTAITKTLGAAS